jgi:integrase
MPNEPFARVKIDQLLRDAGWRLTDGLSVRYEYVLNDGGKPDYALFDRLGRALGVVEAKSTSVDLSSGEAQGRRYADQLGVPYIGTREHLALAVLLYTGLRRGDAARLGRQHIKNGRISVATEKTGMQVTIPLAAELVEAIRAVNLKGLTFVAPGERSAVDQGEFRQLVRRGVEGGGPQGLQRAWATQAGRDATRNERRDRPLSLTLCLAGRAARWPCTTWR